MTCLDAPVGDYESACGSSVRGLRLGVPDEYFAKGLDPEVEASVRAAIAHLEANGCSVTKVHLAHTRHAVAPLTLPQSHRPLLCLAGSIGRKRRPTKKSFPLIITAMVIGIRHTERFC
jgi:Asp-tRNA(Asn)/Glu-tRNA(Gln) amidotransferase A subunit family amidase